jgi:hypothetical protein
MNITHWLRKTPQPVAVLADDKRIDVPRNGRAWRDLTATIASLEPSRLTALNKDGDVIRSVVLETEDDSKAPASAEMTDLQLFAKLLAEAYDKGSKANQPVIDQAMNFVDRQGQRLAKAESEIDRLRGVIHKQHLRMVELSGTPIAGGGDDDSVIGALVAGAMQAASGAAAATLAPPKNGKGAAKQ